MPSESVEQPEVVAEEPTTTPVVEEPDLPPVTPMTPVGVPEGAVSETPLPQLGREQYRDAVIRQALWNIGSQVNLAHDGAENLLPGLPEDSGARVAVARAKSTLVAAHRDLTLALGLVQPR